MNAKTQILIMASIAFIMALTLNSQINSFSSMTLICQSNTPEPTSTPEPSTDVSPEPTSTPEPSTDTTPEPTSTPEPESVDSFVINSNLV